MFYCFFCSGEILFVLLLLGWVGKDLENCIVFIFFNFGGSYEMGFLGVVLYIVLD